MHQLLKTIALPPADELFIGIPSCDDAEAIVAFLNAVGGETDFLTFGHNEFAVSVAQERTILAEFISQEYELMLIGTIDNTVVAHLIIQRSAKKRLAHSGDLSVSVSKKHWGKSIGRHMIETALTWACSHGITKMQLQVGTTNERAVRLYKQLGFVIEGTITQALKIGDIYFDDYLMGLDLRDNSK